MNTKIRPQGWAPTGISANIKKKDMAEIMDYLIAFFGWASIFMIIYGCGHLLDVLALQLKLHQTSIYFWLAGLICGFFIIAETDFPGYQNMTWVQEHLLAAKVIYSSWWLGLLAAIGWISAVWRIAASFYQDIKTEQNPKDCLEK